MTEDRENSLWQAWWPWGWGGHRGRGKGPAGDISEATPGRPLLSRDCEMASGPAGLTCRQTGHPTCPLSPKAGPELPVAPGERPSLTPGQRGRGTGCVRHLSSLTRPPRGGDSLGGWEVKQRLVPTASADKATAGRIRSAGGGANGGLSLPKPHLPGVRARVLRPLGQGTGLWLSY